mmetsp:Transcript_7688/g.13282  ORF Transcript_7688/g.13282 Transcript_7688/m.13282 type:complete len:84 (+) Transcript_7688:754-1005(+)
MLSTSHTLWGGTTNILKQKRTPSVSRTERGSKTPKLQLKARQKHSLVHLNHCSVSLMGEVATSGHDEALMAASQSIELCLTGN